jgi:hypothetical protein
MEATRCRLEPDDKPPGLVAHPSGRDSEVVDERRQRTVQVVHGVITLALELTPTEPERRFLAEQIEELEDAK